VQEQGKSLHRDYRKANEALWRVFLKNEPQYDRLQLKKELEALLKAGGIEQFIRTHAQAATHFPEEQEARSWAESFLAWCS
jgi:hypothetical protein